MRARARGPLRGRLALLGPAFVAAVAYIDPGNFATNIAGGAKYGFLLVWVIVAANLMAMLVQYLSAKTGIATGRNLPELCRDTLPAAGHVGPVGPGGGDRHRDRPGGVRRRRDRAEPAVRGAAVLRRPDHGRRRVRDPGPPDARVPPLRAGDRRLPRHRLPRVPLRPDVRRRRRRRLRRRPDPRLRRHRQHPARGRDPRRDGDAARRVPALGADQPPDPRRGRRRAPRAGALPAPRRRAGDGHRRLHQHDDAGRRRRAVPRLRAHGRGHDRGRARRASRR